MYCSQCGEKIADNVNFCTKCGAQQNGAVDTKEERDVKNSEKKKGNKGKFIAICSIVVLFGVFLVLYRQSVNSSKYEPLSEEALTYNSSLGVFYTAKGTVYQPNHVIEDGDYDVNADYSKWIYREESTKNLFYIDSAFEPVRIAGDVDKFIISYTGKYVAYMCDMDEENAGTLYLYCVKTGESTRIDEEVYPDYLCLSPEGKKVVYLKKESNHDESSMWIGGIGIDSTEVDDDGCYPLAISNNGKTLYYINKTKLYMYNGKTSEKIDSDVSSWVWFNEDLSEILYNSDGKTYMYNKKLKNPQKVSSVSMYSHAGKGIDGEQYYTSGGAFILGVDTLKECVFVSEDRALYWLDSEGTEMIKIAATNFCYQVSKDGKSVIYSLGNKIYKIEQLSNNMDKTILYEGEVDDIIASADLSKIYFYTDEDLYYLKKNGDVERITNDLYVDGTVFFDRIVGAGWAYSNEQDRLFFVENDSLMCVKATAKSKTKVMDDVKNLYRKFDSIVFQDGEFTLYYMGDGEPVILNRD